MWFWNYSCVYIILLYVHERFIRLQSIRYSCWSKILVNSTISYGGRVRLGLESPFTDPDVLLLGGSLLEPRRWAGSVRRYAISAKVWTNCGGALGYCYLESIDKLWGWIWASWRLIAVIVRAATDVYVKSTSEYLWWQAASSGYPATGFEVSFHLSAYFAKCHKPTLNWCYM